MGKASSRPKPSSIYVNGGKPAAGLNGEGISEYVYDGMVLLVKCKVFGWKPGHIYILRIWEGYENADCRCAK